MAVTATTSLAIPGGRIYEKGDFCMKTKSKLAPALALFALAALVPFGIFSGMRRAHAQDQLPPPVTDRISFGMLGIARGQTARINVTNVTAQSDSALPVDPCRVAMAFLNSNGEVLRTSDGQPV